MYHIYHDSNAGELKSYIILALYGNVINFRWAPTIHQLKQPTWTEVEHIRSCTSIEQFLTYYTNNTNANFTHILSFKSFTDLPSLLPEHFI